MAEASSPDGRVGAAGGDDPQNSGVVADSRPPLLRTAVRIVVGKAVDAAEQLLGGVCLEGGVPSRAAFSLLV